MKRAVLVALFAVGTVALFASPEAFNSVVDFSVSTADLVELVRSGRADEIDPEKYLILEGSVASTLLLDPNEETYWAIVELVAGEWIGLEEIEVYRVFVYLEGPQFSNRVVERMPRDPGPEIIQNNTDLTVVASFLGVTDGGDGTDVPVVGAIAVR